MKKQTDIISPKRQQYLDQYRVTSSGRITSPGKFEGELIYVPYFWESFLDGMADGDDGTVVWFRIEPIDRYLFPELPKRKRTIRLQETDNGFVCEV